MSLALEVAAAFSADGTLAGADSRYVPRDAQTDMALAVARAIEDPQALVVEAGTGVGKTFAYLVPALLSGERVLVSTATKALQDQLFGRDLPSLIKALRIDVTTALLKGRSSYLCLERLENARHEAQSMGIGSLRGLAQIEKWSHGTRTGDLAEVEGLDERSPLLPLVTSTRENCLGTPCEHFKKCFVNIARREAMAADLVVINHHLFFADLAVRESGVAELLPTVRIAIFDEAHQLNETGVHFLGTRLSTGQLLDFCRDTLATGLQQARGLVDWQGLVAALEQATRSFRMSAGRRPLGEKVRWTAEAPDGFDTGEWLSGIGVLRDATHHVEQELDTVSEISPDFVRLRERVLSFIAQLDSFSSKPSPEIVRWLDISTHLVLVQSPLNIEIAMRTRVFGTAENSSKTWIFTSATLGDDEKLSWFTEPCGLTDAAILRVESPFDYRSHSAVYVPRDLPKPNDPRHSLRVAQLISAWAGRLGGRTVVLTTTLKALRTIGEALQQSFESSGQLEILIQGTMPKRSLIDRFRRGAEPGEKGCILVGAASFWEGIDFPGDELQLVIIDKLPFPPPNDPLVEARTRLLEAQGRNAFSDYSLPEAAIALKQGAGRLIRRESDQGILVVCDPRLDSMSYGKRLLRAIPPMTKLITEDELLARIDLLTKTCTTRSL